MKKYLNKKIMLIIISVIFISIELSSCYMDVRKEKRIINGELHILTCSEYRSYIDKAIQKYALIHKGIKVNVKTLDQEEIYNYIFSENQYDLITFPGIDMYKYEPRLETIEPYIKDYINEFDNKKLETLNIKNELKGFPIDLRSMGIYYRKDFLNDIGISELDINTWDKFVELGKKIKNEKGMKLITANMKGENSLYTLLINQLLEDFNDSEGKLNFSGDVSVKALSMIKQLYDLDIINIVDDETLPMKNTLDGNTLCFLGSNADLNNIEEYIKDNNLDLILGINKIPAFEAGGNRSVISGLNNIGILKTAKNKDIAKDFLNTLLTDKDVLVEGINNYMIPLYKPIYFNDIFDRNIPVLDNDKGLRKFEYISREAYVRRINENYGLIDHFIFNNITSIIKDYNINEKVKGYSESLVNMIPK